VPIAQQSHRERPRAQWNCGKRLAAITMVTLGLHAGAFANTLAYYRFESGPAGSVATSITDSSGNGRNGSILGSPIYSSSVPPNQTDDTLSLSLGAADGATFNYPFPFNTLANATLEFWVNPSVTSVQFPSLFWTTTGSGDQNRFNITVVPGVGLGMDYREPNGTLHSLVGVGGDAVPVGRWTFVAIVKNGNTYTLYVNNSPVSTVTDSNPNPPTSTGWTINGRATEQPSSCCQFIGLMDEVRISDQALGPSQFLDNISASYYFSQLALGGGWQMTLTYINYSPQAVTCVTNFFSDSGGPLVVPFGGGSVSTRTDTLQPGQSFHDVSKADLNAPVAQGWAQAVCNGPIKASLLYRLYQQGVPVGEAGVNAMTAPAIKFVSFAETRTGVAYANPSATQSALVTFTVVSTAGAKLGSTNLILSPGGHGAANLGPLLGLQNFTGFVEITSSVPIVSLSLNFEAFPVFSSLPPGELSDSTPMVFQ
jgi:hypothetical protein